MAAEMFFDQKNLNDLLRLLEKDDPYPFYGVLLYTPKNGLDGLLHLYVISHWKELNQLTGESCLLLALENKDRKLGIEKFKPEEIYDIARSLGVSGTPVGNIPCIVFFSQPKTRSETLVLKLGEFLPAPSTLTDGDLTDFFRNLSSIIDSCSAKASSRRLQCLKKGLNRKWPRESIWNTRAQQAGKWVVTSTAGAATIVTAIDVIIETFAHLFLR